MNDTPTQAAPFRVTGITTSAEPDGNGGLQRVVNVSYQTPSGITDVHTHPLETANAESVAAAITPKALKLERIRHLGHPSA